MYHCSAFEQCEVRTLCCNCSLGFPAITCDRLLTICWITAQMGVCTSIVLTTNFDHIGRIEKNDNAPVILNRFQDFCIRPTSNCWQSYQRRNEVRCRQGQKANLAPQYSNLRSFGSKCTVLKEAIVKYLGHFGAPRSDSAPT